MQCYNKDLVSPVRPKRRRWNEVRSVNGIHVGATYRRIKRGGGTELIVIQSLPVDGWVETSRGATN